MQAGITVLLAGVSTALVVYFIMYVVRGRRLTKQMRDRGESTKPPRIVLRIVLIIVIVTLYILYLLATRH